MATSDHSLPTPTAKKYGRNKSQSKGAKIRPSLEGAIKSISSPEDFRASLFPLPGKERVRQTIATYGRRCYESYENFIRGGSSVRMLAALLLGTEVWYSSRCTLIWKVQVTKSKRLLFRLQPAAPRTGEIAYGLLATPEALNSEGYQRDGRTGKEYPRLGKQVSMLPTPDAWDGQRGGPRQYNPKGVSQSERTLSAAVHSLIPTPSTHDYKVAGRKGRDSMNSLVEKGVTKGQIGQKTGLKLQPAFALWMMGYPEDWLDLEDGEMPHSKARAMPSSRKSPQK